MSRHFTIRNIHVGLPRSLSGAAQQVSSKPWTSAIFKSSVSEPLWLRSHNLDGDGQADLVHHGGIHKAVCVYSADNFPYWNRELQGIRFQDGAFGENSTIEGMNEHDICIGDSWEIGEALVQVSQPRRPCWKLFQRWKIKDFTLRVQESGLTGWYLRVLQEGIVSKGMRATLVSRPHGGWTIERANYVMHHDKNNLAEAKRLANLPLLSPNSRESLQKRVEQRPQADDQIRLNA